MKRLLTLIKRFAVFFSALSRREKWIVGVTLAALTIFVVQNICAAINETIDDTNQLVTMRQGQLKSISQALYRYNALKQHRDHLEATFEQSQMTFEQVTNELDKIVRSAIGNDNYELKKPNPPSQFGFEYEKQVFSLIVKNLTLEQLVKILHEIEQGGKPLFLSKVDVTKSNVGTDFSTVLEIYSIGKSSAAPHNDSNA